VAGVVERDIPPCRGFDARARSEDAVVLQNDGLARAERMRDARPFVGVQHHAAKIVE
jgi:hypothetical protein